MLLAGMDVSGDKINGEEKYISIVIGENECVNRLSSELGPMNVHMANLSPNQKDRIIKIIQNRYDDVLAFCITMDKKKIVDSIYALRKIQRKNYPISKVKSTFERALFQKVKPRIEQFCVSKAESLTTVKFQCESDCRPLARSNSLIADSVGEAHKIADVIAWCNHKRTTIEWVNEIDLTDDIPIAMKKMLKLN